MAGADVLLCANCQDAALYNADGWDEALGRVAALCERCAKKKPVRDETWAERATRRSWEYALGLGKVTDR